MKIVHVTQFFHPERGYQENKMAIYNRSCGDEVTIICTDNIELWGGDEQQDKFKLMDRAYSSEHGVKVIRLPRITTLSQRVFVKGLGELLSKENPDLLVLHGVTLPMTITGLSWISKHSSCRVIVDDHMVKAGIVNKATKPLNFLFRVFFRLFLKIKNIKVDKWVGVSKETVDIIKNSYGIQDEVELVLLGYDHHTVFRDVDFGHSWLKENNLSLNDKYILYIGKVDHFKDPRDVLTAFDLTKSNNSLPEEYKLLIVGDISENYKNKFFSHLSNMAFKDSVHVLKPVPNVEIRKVFSIAEVAIWPHGSSMAMFEAMACGCPVIAPEMEVNQERLENGRGLIFEENNTESLANNILLSLQKGKEITTKASSWVLDYSWTAISKAFFKL
ncbi:glycosyltransferase family 4 protein [Aliikangiella sp. IMCC44359]|uniref:glycosyltransferase family 4 protein n=1 Tax=Aliikangiella sp. IMCC44359 TaxID=3459125 RepID=UPI00403ABBE9